MEKKKEPRQHAAAEIARGDDSRRAAELLLEADLAALFTTSGQSRTYGDHLQRELVRTGQFDAAAVNLFARLKRSREHADYTCGYVFTSDDAAEQLAAADAFIAVARRRLVTERLLDP